MREKDRERTREKKTGRMIEREGVEKEKKKERERAEGEKRAREREIGEENRGKE